MKYNDFLKLNEDIETNFDPSERLRNCVHDIVTNSTKDTILFKEISQILMDEYKINISDDILKEIFTEWDFRKNYTTFKKSDSNWLDVWSYLGYLKKKTRYKQNFGKHRIKTSYIPPTTNTNWRQSYPETKKDVDNRSNFWSNYYYGD